MKMKMTQSTLLGMVAAAFVSLTMLGCERNGHEHHEGDGHDHDHGDHETTEPAAPPAESSSAGDSAAAAKDDYPLKVCVVSGEDLGSMGEPVVINHEGTTVKFCCDSCVDDFNEDPEKYLAKLKES